MPFKKRMTKSEALRHFIYLNQSQIETLGLKKNGPVRVKVAGIVLDLRLDNQYRIWASLFGDHLRWNPGSEIVIDRAKDGTITISQTDV